MNVARIRGFLLQLPKPASVRYTVGDGDSQPLKLGRSYVKIAETIEALGVELLECFDPQGVLLRAMRITAAEAQRSDAAAIPKGIEADPQALMLTHFANLLHRAYEHSTEIAFAKMVEITGIMSERSDAIEQRLERAETLNRRLHQEQIDDAFERAEEEAERKAAEVAAGGNGMVEQMASAFLSGKMNGAAAPNGAARTNGKGKGAS
jgi:hypothetical protein